MKRLALLIIALLLLLMSSCVPMQVRTRTMGTDEMANVNVIGNVETEFGSWQWFHVNNEKGVGKKAYKKLKKVAAQKFSNVDDIDVVNVYAYTKHTSFLFSINPFVLIFGNIFGSNHTIGATGDVISADKTYVAPKQERPLEVAVAPEQRNATEQIKNTVIPQENPNVPSPKPTIAPSNQNLPKITVYVSGNLNANDKKALEARMLTSIFKSGRYRVVDRSEESTDKLAAEHIKQRDGSVDEEQIKRLGKQYGVDFICIAYVNPAFGKLQVSVRILNVETAEVVFADDDSGQLRSMEDLPRALDRIFEKMFGIQTAAAPERKQENIVATVAPAPVSAQKLMKPKYENTKMYPSEHLEPMALTQ